MKTGLIKYTALAVLSLMSVGCTTTAFHFTSDPPGANVYYFDPVTQKRFLMGSTPLTYSKSSIPNDKPFLVSVEMEGYQSVEVPVAPTNGTKTFINFTLKRDETGLKRTDLEINAVVNRLFKAQMLIFNKRYQSAIIELEQILKERPNLVQAYIMRGTAYYMLQEMNSALESWRKAMALDSNNEELKRFLEENNISL